MDTNTNLRTSQYRAIEIAKSSYLAMQKQSHHVSGNGMQMNVHTHTHTLVYTDTPIHTHSLMHTFTLIHKHGA